jgi:NAD(P)-dependent dehydrogenase (short-subunit alcohol dehydrogenase family)
VGAPSDGRPCEGREPQRLVVIIITGGAKGLGLKLAKALAKQTGATIALVGRSAPSEEVAKACAQVKGAARRRAPTTRWTCVTPPT